MRLWPWGSPPSPRDEDPAESDLWDALKHPPHLEPPPLIEGLNAVRMSDGTLVHYQADASCAEHKALAELYRRSPPPPGWNDGTTETRLPSPAADTEEIPIVREEKPVTEQIAPPTADYADPARACPRCRGRGVIPTVADLLRESVALISDGDALVRMLYTLMMQRAPHLEILFPADLISAALGETDSDGASQREVMLAHIVGWASNYDDNDPAAMEYVNRLARAAGRQHVLFWRGDNVPPQGATCDEYALVKALFFEALHEVGGSAWLPEYDAAWSQAYDDLQIEMQHAAKAEREQAKAEGRTLTARRPRRRNVEIRAAGLYGPDDPGSGDRI